MEDNTKKILFAYYLKLMKEYGMDVDENKLDYIIGGLDEKEQLLLVKRISFADSDFKHDWVITDPTLGTIVIEPKKSADSLEMDFLKRYMAYIAAIKPTKETIADDMNAVLRALGDYDFSKELSLEVNGNTFIYEEGFPIENYMDELKNIGEHEQGEKYSVYLCDGKLVIY